VTAISSNEPVPLEARIERGIHVHDEASDRAVDAERERPGFVEAVGLGLRTMKRSTAAASRSLSMATERQCCAGAVASRAAVSLAAAGQAAAQSTP
jgi:hypothetical protein